jgi:peptidyl-prolyl cis-trans isomerase C
VPEAIKEKPVSYPLVKLFKEPLIQFLILGAAIYGAYALLGAPEDDFRDTTIVVDSNRIDSMISEWESRWNRPPSRQEMDALIQQYIKEDVLYRQAVAMGLNKDDPVMRRRMAQKLEFLTSDLSAMQVPAQGELEQFFTEHQQSYRDPDRISLSHIYFDPDKREGATLIDAEATLARLKEKGEPGEEISELGDRFMLQSFFDSATELDIRRQLGSGFSEVVMGLEPGQWFGPVMSGYGVHLVYIYDRFAAPPPVFENVQARVLEDWHAQKREQFNAQFLENLKSRYEIVIDELPAERLLDGQIEAARKKAAEDAAGAEAVVEPDTTS